MKRDRLYWVNSRPDAVGKEMFGDHPWLTLSGDETHDQGLFIGVVQTTGFHPLYEPAGVKSNRGEDCSYDCQQIWTFTNNRLIRPHDQQQHRDGMRELRRVIRDSIALEQQAPAVSRDGLAQGRVVWVNLEPQNWERVMRGSSVLVPEGGSDIVTYRKIIRHLIGRQPKNPNGWLVPAMVLSSMRFWRTREERLGGQARALVTVCPLVSEPELLGLGAPRVQNPADHGETYAPLTQYILSVDYESETNANDRRVLCERDGFACWDVDEHERSVIIAEVLGLLGMTDHE